MDIYFKYRDRHWNQSDRVLVLSDDVFQTGSVSRYVIWTFSATAVYRRLQRAELYAQKNKVDLFSLDMWGTKHYEGGAETEWSFGITYVNNQIAWMEYMVKHCIDEEYKQKNYANFDRYFIYLRMLKEYSIELFYFENLRFIHYSDDFFRRIVRSGFYYWKDGYLRFPILETCLGFKELGKIAIPSNIVKLDINILDEEVKKAYIDSILDKDLYDVLTAKAEEYLKKTKETNYEITAGYENYSD